MDRIIEGYLGRFVSDLGFDKKEKELNFERFCFYSILKNELNFLDDNDLDEISVGKNKGIDGICISIDGNALTNFSEVDEIRDAKKNFDTTIYFIQSKSSSKFEDSQIANFCDTVIDFLSEKPKYTLTSKAEEYHKIYLEILALMPYLKSFNCKLFYCSTGKWNEGTSCSVTIEKKIEEIKKLEIFKNDLILIKPIDNDKLRKLYDKGNQPLITEFNFINKISLNKIDKVKDSVIGVLPFTELKKIIIDFETDKLKPLFYDNVRDFLGLDDDVNSNINLSLHEKHFSLFQLLNNGITIIAEENKGRGNTFILNNYQIINGCQTSNILYMNRDLEGIENLFIPVKLIITEDEDIRDKIIVSSNNQTKIKEEQLLALTSFQKSLEEYYNQMEDGLYYERRKSQYSNNPSILKKSIVDIREQIKSYVGMFLDEPHAISGYFGKVFRDRKSQIFVKDHKIEPYYISGLTQFKFKNFINTKKIDRKYNKARYHIFMLFRKICEPFEKVDSASNKIKSYCDAIYKILVNDKKCLKQFLNVTEVIDSSGINVEDQKEIYKKSTTNTLIEEFNKLYK